ncbi:MAG: hypothetical protein GY854_17735 [Deltaproteobacteria bacterium]|nr:hypothetical protein [Deltaproteobacteria bacterium]
MSANGTKREDGQSKQKEYKNAIGLLVFVSFYLGILSRSLSTLDCQAVIPFQRDAAAYYTLFFLLGPVMIYLAFKATSIRLRISYVLTMVVLLASQTFIHAKEAYLIMGKIGILFLVMSCLLPYLLRRE